MAKKFHLYLLLDFTVRPYNRFFAKKMKKNLQSSKKVRTFAPANEKKGTQMVP